MKVSGSGSSGQRLREGGGDLRKREPSEEPLQLWTKHFRPTGSPCFLLLNSNSITTPNPETNHTWLSEGRNQTLLYKAQWPSLASLLRYEVPASEHSSPSPRPHHPSSPPDTHLCNSTTSKKYSEEEQDGGVRGSGWLASLFPRGS